MKTYQILSVSLLFVAQSSLFAQKTATWKGGTAGRTTDWNCPTNWLEGRVPNQFSDVFLDDVTTSTFASPVISSGESVEINALFVAPTANLTLKTDSQLTVFNTAEGVFHGTILGEGRLLLLDGKAEKLAADSSVAIQPARF